MSATTTARERALDRLLRIEEHGAYISRVSGEDLDLDDAREERQASEYVAGVTRQRRWLDFLIDHFYRGESHTLEPVLRQILRIGLYDLVILATPAHAAVNEAVEIAKRRVRPDAGSLVNAILRTASREDLPQPDSGRQVRDLAVRYSQPNWVVRRWLNRFGEEEATRMLEFANERPAYSLRVNTLRHRPDELGKWLDELSVDWEPSPILEEFLRVGRLQDVLRSDLLQDGACAVQDEAAALVVRLLDPRPGDSVIDVAAAPGGKAIYSALRMYNEGRIQAFDVHETRLELVARSAEAHGVTIIETRAADLRELANDPARPTASHVLLDAPCSGLGVLSKRADLRWRRTEADIPQLCALQDELLDAACKLVAPEGLLVYSTCTTEPEENEERVAAFLDRHPEFVAERADGFVPDEMITSAGYYLALPQRHETDGAFGARLRRL